MRKGCRKARRPPKVASENASGPRACSGQANRAFSSEFVRPCEQPGCAGPGFASWPPAWHALTVLGATPVLCPRAGEHGQWLATVFLRVDALALLGLSDRRARRCAASFRMSCRAAAA